MRKKSLVPQDKLGVQISLLASISIFLGVYLQVGDNRFAPNISLKVIGILLPLIIASLILLFRNRINDFFWFSRFELFWIFSLISLSIAQFTNTTNKIYFFYGTPDRNLALTTYMLLMMGYFVGKYLGRFNLQVFIFSIVTFSVVQSLVVLYQRFLKPDVIGVTGSPETPGIFGTFYNSNPLSFFLGITCSAFLVFILNFKGTKINLISLYIAALILIAGLLVSGSSQGLIGFIGTLIVYLLKKYIRIVKYNFNSFLIAVYSVSLLTFIGAISLYPLKADSDITTNPYLERLEIYKSAVSMFLQNPFLGVGTDSFASNYGAFTTSTDLKLVDNAHSIFLQTLSTQGLLGGLLLLSLIISILKLKYIEVNAKEAQWSFFQSAFFAFSLIGIIGIEHPTISFFAYLSAGVLSGMSENSKVTNQIKLKAKTITISALVIGLLVAVITVPNTARDFRVSSALTKLSLLQITEQQFKEALPKNYGEITNSRLLLNLGQAFVALDDRDSANRISMVMLKDFPEDQRTSVMFFMIGEKWSDDEANRIATVIRDRLFPHNLNP